MSELTRALEATLAADFNDLAAHAAYADLLMDQGDPRGEFIQVQLALEDERLLAEEQLRLKGRAAELLAAHKHQWLRDLALALLASPVNHCHWTRGWIDGLYLWEIDVPTAQALARCPATRLLQRLHIDQSGYGCDSQTEPSDGIPEGSEYPNLYPLQLAPFLPCLRVFQLGETVDFEEGHYNCRTSGEGAVELIAQMTRLAELNLLADETDLARLFALPGLTNLHTLVAYHDRDVYPLEILADNPALGRLTTLRVHPAHSRDNDALLRREQIIALLHSPHLKSLTNLHLHGSDLGDEGCQDIVESGILRRLKVLDLRHGCIHDDGARLLAACPDLRNLELLNLESNELTEEGQAVLRRLGINVRCEIQNTVGENSYLYSGDME
jgi:uncharacterized protein (TIGR02996 family)